jgi:murein DD-endopeptidase MepM/ murein hydrolase activator NlpD
MNSPGLWGMLIGLGLVLPTGFAAAPAGQLPRQTEVSDLGSNEHLPQALLAVYSPEPAALVALQSAPPAAAGPGSPPRLGYPINQAPIEISAFGMRFSEARNAMRMHTGLDLIVTEGTPVLAAATGTVRLVDEVSGYGLTVVVDHGGGWQTLYAHLFELAVKPGERVSAGQPLGRVGDSGRATTPHLHFEVRQRREGRVIALDPAPLLTSPGTGRSLANR